MSKIVKHKKFIMVTGLVIIVLFICYLIGQNIVLPNRMKADGYLDINGRIPEYSILENVNNFAFGGQKDMDVLGGKSISMVDLNKDNSELSESWLGKSIFMTPGTSMAQRMKFKKNYNKISFKYAMYPTISKEISDGANIVIELYGDEGKKPILRKVYEVTPEKDFESVELDISKINNTEMTLAISCNNGLNNNEDGDWVLIKNLCVVR